LPGAMAAQQIQCHHHHYLLDYHLQGDTPMNPNLHYFFSCLLISPLL